MNNMGRTFAFAAAMAVVAAYVLMYFSGTALDTLPARLLTAAIITALAWRLFARKPAPPSTTTPEKNIYPKVGTRRWARAMYHNGFISIEELQQFYNEHPEAEDEF